MSNYTSAFNYGDGPAAPVIIPHPNRKPCPETAPLRVDSARADGFSNRLSCARSWAA